MPLEMKEGYNIQLLILWLLLHILFSFFPSVHNSQGKACPEHYYLFNCVVFHQNHIFSISFFHISKGWNRHGSPKTSTSRPYMIFSSSELSAHIICIIHLVLNHILLCYLSYIFNSCIVLFSQGLDISS